MDDSELAEAVRGFDSYLIDDLFKAHYSSPSLLG
jgi:hypothetical protein